MLLRVLYRLIAHTWYDRSVLRYFVDARFNAYVGVIWFCLRYVLVAFAHHTRLTRELTGTCYHTRRSLSLLTTRIDCGCMPSYKSYNIDWRKRKRQCRRGAYDERLVVRAISAERKTSLVSLRRIRCAQPLVATVLGSLASAHRDELLLLHTTATILTLVSSIRNGDTSVLQYRVSHTRYLV